MMRTQRGGKNFKKPCHWPDNSASWKVIVLLRTQQQYLILSPLRSKYPVFPCTMGLHSQNFVCLSYLLFFSFFLVPIAPPASNFIQSSSGHHGFHYKMPSPILGLLYIPLYISYFFVQFYFCYQLLFLYIPCTVMLKAIEIHYFCWFCSITIGKEFFLQHISWI